MVQVHKVWSKMNCTKLTKGIYYFTDVLSHEMHEVFEETVKSHNFKLDSRSGSVFNVGSAYPEFWGMMLMVRENMFEYIFHDDEEIKESYSYDRRAFDFLNILAKGAQHREQSHYHTDNDHNLQYSLLYYPHLKWEDDWGGELSLGNSIIVTPVPNSAIVFPSHIPHSINPVSVDVEGWRLTVFGRSSNIIQNKFNDLNIRLVEGAFKDELIQPKQIKLEK